MTSYVPAFLVWEMTQVDSNLVSNTENVNINQLLVFIVPSISRVLPTTALQKQQSSSKRWFIQVYYGKLLYSILVMLVAPVKKLNPKENVVCILADHY